MVPHAITGSEHMAFIGFDLALLPGGGCLPKGSLTPVIRMLPTSCRRDIRHVTEEGGPAPRQRQPG
jgi:hypothetical protein